MKNVKLISLALSMLVCFVAKAQEKTIPKDTLSSILNNKIVICAISKPLTIEPLTILDGRIINAKQFSTVNPNEIESIKVLKGTEATSIYGSQGVNGVIIITSKRKQ